MKSSLLAIIVLFFVSCGRDQSRAPASKLGSELKIASSISGLQKNIAVNICFELKSKNILWRNNLLNTNFNFKVEESECSKLPEPTRTVTTTLKGPINAEAMRFDPTPGQILPFDEVATDLHGILGEYCTDILKGNIVSDTVSDTNGTRQISFQQASASGFDGFTLLYFRANELVSYKEVVTEIALNGTELPSVTHKGIEKVIRSRETCLGGGTASITQTYLP